MLVVVQFPFIDLRSIVGTELLSMPPWLALGGKEHTDHLHFFGASRTQPDFNFTPSPWADDKYYISARNALRFTGKLRRHELTAVGGVGKHHRNHYHPYFSTYQSPNAKTDFYFLPAFRRVHFDGEVIGRIDVGLWVFGNTPLDGKQLLDLVKDLLSLEVIVGKGHKNQDGRPISQGALGLQGKALAQLFHQARRLFVISCGTRH